MKNEIFILILIFFFILNLMAAYLTYAEFQKYNEKLEKCNCEMFCKPTYENLTKYFNFSKTDIQSQH